MGRYRPKRKEKAIPKKFILTLFIIALVIIFAFLLIDPIFDLYKQIIQALEEAMKL